MHLHLSVFAYGGLTAPTVESLLGEMEAIRGVGHGLTLRTVVDDALISRARSIVLSEAIHREADVAVMVDRDIAWQPGDVVALAERAAKADAVIGGLYARRGGKGIAAVLLDTGAEPRAGEDRMHAAENVGAGFLAAPVSLARGMVGRLAREEPMLRLNACAHRDGGAVARYWDFFRPMIVDGGEGGVRAFLGEDVSFCRRVRAAGRDVYLWTGPRLRHYGETAWSG